MRKIIYKTTVALNGLIEMPGEPADWVIADEEVFRYTKKLPVGRGETKSHPTIGQ